MNPTTPAFPPEPSRVSYNQGMLLDSSDFQDEQSYHRGQLARVLQRLIGFGTAAGLKVQWFPKGSIRAEDNQPRTEEELEVSSGIAVDRPGRIIEVEKPQCLRLARWFDFQTAQHPEKIVPLVDGASRFLIADVFLRFLESPQGLRPSFPDAAVDASDAVVASRTLDYFELILEPRRCDPNTSEPPVPANNFPAQTTRRDLLDKVVYPSYAPPPPVEYPVYFGDQLADQSAVFLARIRIPLLDAPDTTLGRKSAVDVVVEDIDRPLIPAAAALLTVLPTA